ncbi:MAG: bacterial proteasome activator family protein [Actinobacteria bacterium]|nr:bacterial proteasome activator family protein [Actinomycetota bacterium]
MGEGSELERAARAVNEARQEGDDDSGLVVVPFDDEGDQRHSDEEIEHPAKLIRIATMIQRLLVELREVELDEASRRRLVEIYNRSIEGLRDVLSDDLRNELSQMVIHRLAAEDPPTPSELRIIHAQLVGWLDGLFEAVQASIASQQLAAAQQQLARVRQQPALRPGRADAPEQGASGQYL